MNDDQPTVEEELVRKAGETLLWLDNERQRGSISTEAFCVAVTVFDMITMGITPMEYNDCANNARNEVLTRKYPDKVVGVTAAGAVAVLELLRDVGEVMVTHIKSGVVTKKIYSFEKESDPVKTASIKFIVMVDGMISKLGYRIA